MARILAALLLLADAGRTVRNTPPFPETFKSRILASANARQVWGIDPAEIEWASAHLDGILATHVRWSAAGGGLRVDELRSGGIAAARGLQAGDVVMELNRFPLGSSSDLRKVLASAEFRQSRAIRLDLRRGGQPLVLEYRPWPK